MLIICIYGIAIAMQKRTARSTASGIVEHYSHKEPLQYFAYVKNIYLGAIEFHAVKSPLVVPSNGTKRNHDVGFPPYIASETPTRRKKVACSSSPLIRVARGRHFHRIEKIRLRSSSLSKHLPARGSHRVIETIAPRSPFYLQKTRRCASRKE